MAEGDFAGAYEVISTTNALPGDLLAVYVRRKTSAKAKCVRGIEGRACVGIGRLERFAADYARERWCSPMPWTNRSSNGKKVAVIGSGPARPDLRWRPGRAGYEVTIFEALHTPGGVLVYGIPEFRLPKELVLPRDLTRSEALGATIDCNAVVRPCPSTIKELMEDMGYSAVFVGSGAGLPTLYEAAGREPQRAFIPPMNS